MAYNRDTIWGNLGQVGEKFGLTPLESGKKLKELGYRDPDGKPSGLAIKEKVVKEMKSADFGVFYLWHIEKFYTILEDSGLSELFGKEKSIFVLSKMWMKHHDSYKKKKLDTAFYSYNKFFFNDVVKKELVEDINAYLLDHNFQILLTEDCYVPY